MTKSFESRKIATFVSSVNDPDEMLEYAQVYRMRACMRAPTRVQERLSEE